MRRGRQTPTFEYVGGYDHSDGTLIIGAVIGAVCTAIYVLRWPIIIGCVAAILWHAL